MPTAFRVLARAGSLVGDADTIDEVLELVKAAAPGRYRLIKFYLDRPSGDLRCWAWGLVAHDRRGRVRLEIPPNDA
jgi:hypothetical protein